MAVVKAVHQSVGSHRRRGASLHWDTRRVKISGLIASSFAVAMQAGGNHVALKEKRAVHS
jgi:hypothetical protein